MNEIQLAGRKIGRNSQPFIIAELSGNHNQSLGRALEIVKMAAKMGADAVKIQTYTADSMTLDLTKGDFVISDPNSIWHGRSLYELYEEASIPWDWHQPIFEQCKKLGLIGFSTPFDEKAVDFLETQNVPCYKIASFECTDLSLIRKVAKTGKPLFLSTGTCSVSEIQDAVDTARTAGCHELILLKCTSAYPAAPGDANITTIPHMRDLFRCQVGLSDHTLGVGVAVASVALGATVIEKHFTLSRTDGGVDARFSLEPEELKTLVTETNHAWQSLGSVYYGATKSEKPSQKYRRSLYITTDMKAGDLLSPENLRVIRPGYGLPPKHYDLLLGRAVVRNVTKGTPLSWDLI